MSEITTRRAHPWWVIPRPRRSARVRILCLPHAGSGSSAYVSWGRRLPDDIELCIVAPPGREHRTDEPPVRTLETYVDGLVSAVVQETDLPWVIFGHSFGAIVGYEVARRLAEAGRAPAHLVLSARGFPNDLPAREPMHLLPDDALIALMRRLYGGFAANVEDYPELLTDVLTALRADLAMMESFRPRFLPLLPNPVTVFWSPEDRSSTEQDIRDWRQVSGSTISFEAFEGGHFYLFDRSADVISRLAHVAASATRTA